ncbi:Ger(x)C family spore germination protein [Aneurinibacillus aneurinilyticus]|uniref:Germination protein, Ger(X)C family n=1 Tax=Aneurinibacillus aneurinilyticus ATCC 12856 TaxID=649747 RepID=U1WGH2_ANEAE|nr:Ger(x)C family spore germination protein [Aneurinibacillus aneurinilyticus]ERI07674.1 germination protein, Ger(x)C family [Aneurinibacillus aneurinilyticus ATCC 12856]MED0705596.1 Ger(x)C family spore germination protein [Aneurinibacillus aneurinilyticus]MED0724487.1 Ger(x)C family spore germination protein [Aneurinibacillus aneurinilyticus]MED0731322.1 Ger(x)C family spore germination protein [Aneurinibacillus aneurinilyticus]MED0739356.1 Ger(x)C family spore germination protein [Aneurinib
MMQKRWKPLLLVALLLLPLLQGCGTAEGGIAVRELNQLNVVMLTGVDYDPKHKKFIITIQSVKPSREKGAAVKPESVYTARATGDTIMEASKNLRAQTSGKLVWFYSRVIIFGETLVKQHVMREVIDFFARNREIRYSSWVLISKGAAEDIVTAQPNSEVMMGYELVGIINNQGEWGRTVVVSQRDLINNYANPYIGFVTGQVKKIKGKDKKDKIIIEDAVVLNSFNPRDPIYNNVLDKKDVRALRMFQKFSKQEPEFVYSVLLDKKSERKFDTAVQIKIDNRKIKSVIENGRPKIMIDLFVQGTILESGAHVDIGKENTVIELERRIQNKIVGDMKKLLAKMQKEKVDIFEFSSIIHRQHKKYWREHKQHWREIYPNIPVHISIHWTNLRSGMINQAKAGEAR